MRFLIIFLMAFSLAAVNCAPEYAYAKTDKVSKTKAKKSTKSKKSKANKNKQSKKNKKSKAKSSSRKSAKKALATNVYAPKYSEFLVDGETGRILHQENANAIRYPASLTKMMTIYLTFEQIKAGNLRMGSNLRVSAYAASMPKTNLSLDPGDTITVREAVLALIVHSANDVAVVLAEAIGGDEDRFARIMTERANQLGMKNTVFKNPSGLHDPEQITTAKDMALLGIALKRHYPEYYNMFSRTYFTFNGRSYESHNRVTRSYSGAEGLKTGFIRASGFNLVTSASRYEGNLVGVVMGGRTAAGRDERMKELLDKGFDKLATMKKKEKFAGKLTRNDALSFASLEPASGGNGKQINIEEPQDSDEEALHEDETKSGFHKKSSVNNNKKAEMRVVVNGAPKPFANDFIPYPKEKPNKLASL